MSTPLYQLTASSLPTQFTWLLIQKEHFSLHTRVKEVVQQIRQTMPEELFNQHYKEVDASTIHLLDSNLPAPNIFYLSLFILSIYT